MKKTLIGIILFLLVVLPALSIPAVANAETTLSLQIFGGLPLPKFIHVVSGVIANVGGSPAYNVSYTFTITGGFTGDINMTASDNTSELAPGSGIAFGFTGTSGFGPVIITLTASASNADNVTRSVKGVQLRGFTWVPLAWVIPPLFKDFIPWLNWHPARIRGFVGNNFLNFVSFNNDNLP